MNRRKKPILPILALTITVGVASCMPQNVEPTRKIETNEIRVGVIASITGNIPNVGKSTVEAAEMAAKEINDAGGLKVGDANYQITLVVEDDQDNAEAAVAAAEKLINQSGVHVIVGPQASRNAVPVSRLAENAKVPMISPWSTNPETTKDKQYVYRVAFIDPFQGQVMAKFVFEELRVTNAAVLYDIASPYNSGIAEIFKQVFETAGGKVTAFESYTTGETDFTKQLTAIQESGAEVLFLPNYENEVPLQAKQARALGLNIPIIGSDSWGTIAADDRVALEGAFFSAHYAPDITEEPAKTFIEKYKRIYGTVPDDVAALTYDAFQLLFAAIQAQGKFETESIRAGLAGIEAFSGVTGTMQFRDSGDPIKSAVILQVKNGEFVFYKLASP